VDTKVDTYNPAIDLLRILAIISVLLIHTSTKVLELTKYDFVGHPFSFFINEATRFAVPVFFLISAFLLELNYPQKFKYSVYFKQRISRLFLPYLFWSLIYFFFIYPGGNNFFLSFLSGGASYQLYFIPSLFIFYLFFPILHNLQKFFSNKFSLIFFGLLQLGLLTNDYYFKPMPLPQPIGVFILNLDVFILGILACHYQNNILNFVKKYKYLLISSNFILAFAITFDAAWRYQQTNNYLFFYSNWRPLAFIYTLSISSLLFYYFSKTKINHDIIKKLSSYSFFVYFIHIIFIEIVCQNFPKFFSSHTPVLFLLVAIPSYLLAFIASKIPHLSRLTG
jgi:probable poly-beta-1,6-N-acetyl-D-glucosamine export protein